MRVNVGQAKMDLSKLLARVRPVRTWRSHVTEFLWRGWCESSPAAGGARFLAAEGALAGQIAIADDFELSDAEIDRMRDCSTAIRSIAC
jgi:hypothetical protein